MPRIELVELENAIASSPLHNPGHATTLQVATMPYPYVPPPLHIIDGELPAEVIFIRAPAAVGKSITARFLSAQRNLPLLDLANVAVGTGSLQGLLTDYARDGQNAFHDGKLAIVIDALDEGRLLSGESSFEAFLESAVAFLGHDRTRTNHTKAILLGREESADLSSLAVQIANHEISTCTLQLDFFDKDAASRLIDLSAEKELSRLLETHQIKQEDHDRRSALLRGGPMAQLKDAYFSAIESALELEQGLLWKLDRGRTFAGYAPVLGSIGTLLAAVDNPLPVTNRLEATATREAWDVIDTVIHEIIEREQKKLVDQLAEISVVPENAYNRHEQLSYLAQLIGGQQRLTLTGDVSFQTEADRMVYFNKVSQICAEHPFIRSRKVANDVLGSTIMAHAICHGTQIEHAHTSLFRELCRGPFLWRSFCRELANQESPLFDGRFLGYILSSYWNDPMERKEPRPPVQVTETTDGTAAITIGSRAANEFTTMPPVAFYGRVQDCQITATGLDLVFEGATADKGGSSSRFVFQGHNRVRCSQLTYSAASTDVSGSLWLEAEEVIVTAHDPEIHAKGVFRYGWGGAVMNSEPWKQLATPTLPTPFGDNPLARLFADCRVNIPPNGIVLMDDYSIPEGDNQLNWTRRHGDAVPLLVKLLVEEGLAERELLPTRRRDNKYRIRANNLPWDDIQRACDGRPGVDENTQDLVEKARQVVGVDG